MYFVVIGRDKPDSDALRDAARAAHVEKTSELRARGFIVFSAPIADPENEARPIGSLVVVQADSRAEVDAWLAEEPFAVQGVWGEFTVDRLRPSTSLAAVTSVVDP